MTWIHLLDLSKLYSNSSPFPFFRKEDKVELSWYVNTNEDVGGFRLELRSAGIPQTTLFSKEIPYDQRQDVIRVGPEFGDDWTMCVLVENSSGRLRRWKQENCKKASLISSAKSVLKHASSQLLLTILAASLVLYVWEMLVYQDLYSDWLWNRFIKS